MTAAARIKASWLDQAGRRLDASFYSGPGQRDARAFIACKIKKKALRDLTVGGEDGIFIPPRFKRNYVENPDFGYPYLAGASITQSDPLSNCKYLSQKYTNDLGTLLFRPDTIVITCSGNIGNAAYVSEYFNGALGSPDLLRIVPDKKKIAPGYLYAFLTSRIGQALIKQSTYGSVVQHIEAHHIYNLLIPTLKKSNSHQIGKLVKKSSQLRSQSNKEINLLKQKIEDILAKHCKDQLVNQPIKAKHLKANLLNLFEKRLDASFYASGGRLLYDNIVKGKHNTLGSIADIFHPIIFGKKQLKGTEKAGIPLYSSSSMMKIAPETKFMLSHKKSQLFEKLRVKSGYILISRTGTVGNVIRISESWDGKFIDDHMIRIIPKKGYSGLIYLFLKTALGRSLSEFQKYGSVQDVLKDVLVERIPIPIDLLEPSFVKKMDDKVEKAFEQFDQALILENQAIEMIEQELSKWLD